jgi:hypothetical protein
MPKRKKQGDREVDVFAGGGSFADKLRRRRQAIEQGDPAGGEAFRQSDETAEKVREAIQGAPKKKKRK